MPKYKAEVEAWVVIKEFEAENEDEAHDIACELFFDQYVISRLDITEVKPLMWPPNHSRNESKQKEDEA